MLYNIIYYIVLQFLRLLFDPKLEQKMFVFTVFLTHFRQKWSTGDPQVASACSWSNLSDPWIDVKVILKFI